MTGAAMGYYHWRVTGSPWLPPALLHQRTYYDVPNFLFQKAADQPLSWPDPNLTLQAATYREMFLAQRGLRGSLSAAMDKVRRHARYYLGLRFSLAWYWQLPLCLPVLFLPGARRERATWAALGICALVFAGVLTISWDGTHYFAPATAFVFLLLVQGMRRLNAWRWGQVRLGRLLVVALLVFDALLLIPEIRWAYLRNRYGWAAERARLIERLEEDGRHHLILVRYGPTHHPYVEWVYNGADVDEARVVWAQDMPSRANAELLAYYPERVAWLLDLTAGDHKPVLRTYGEEVERDPAVVPPMAIAP